MSQLSFQMNGKILSSQFVNQKYYTTVITPAPDAYSQPSTFKVQSDSQLGGTGQEVSLFCKASGYVKDKPYVDKTTGENKIYQDATVFFHAELDSIKGSK